MTDTNIIFFAQCFSIHIELQHWAKKSEIGPANVEINPPPISHLSIHTKCTVPRISFRFRLPYGKSYQLTRLQFPLRLAYAMTYNKSQSQTLSKVLLDITTPPFSHGQLYVALSRVRDCNNIMMYLTEEQLIINDSHSTGFMPSVYNIVYQDVLIHNS